MVNAAAGNVPPAKRQRPRAVTPLKPVSDDRTYLYRIIETIGAGPDLDAILRGIVSLVTEATGCHACFIYFVQGDRLVLRAASSMYAHLQTRVHFSTDEGLTGWVVRTRRSAFIKENALDDPRVHYIPEMEEERFQSMVSVPVLSRAGGVIAVINLHTEAPREFAPADLEFLEHTASLVAGAIDNARLYEAATERVSLLTDLSRLSQDIASAGSVSALLSTVTAGCQRLLTAERVEIYLLDPDGRLALRAASPERSQWPVLDARKLRLDSLALDSEADPGAEGRALAAALWGDDLRGAPLFAPLSAGDERSGLLGVVLPEPRPHAQSIVWAIASHTAVALKHHELVGRLREESLVKDFFEALSQGHGDSDELEAQTAQLGLDLKNPHAVLHAVPWTGKPPVRQRRTGRGVDVEPGPWEDLVAALESSVSPKLPGAVFDCRPSSARALIPLPAAGEAAVVDAMQKVYSRVVGDKRGWTTIGLSNPCTGRGSFPRAFGEAASAAEVGALIKGAPGVYTYEDLGPYRYVLSADESFRDRHQQRLDLLVEYDARRGTELLRTLEAYLEGRGNVVGTARTLYTHPNTLRQRLSRIERLCGFDLEQEDWLSLAIAIKLVKLRLARRSARVEEGEDRG